MKKRNLVIILIVLIIIFIVSIVGYFVLNNIHYSNIKKGASSWYKDHNGEYDKTTIGALYENGYINNNKSLIVKKNLNCRVINFNNEKVSISKEYDCNLNDKMKVIPTMNVKFLNDNNFSFDSGDWIGNYRVSLNFKNDLYNDDDISSIKFYGPYDIILENNVIMNDYIDGDYVIEVCFKNNTCTHKDVVLRVDTTAPIYNSSNVNDNYFEALYSDEESGVRDVYYYISESDTPPEDISLFSKKEYLKFEKDKEYNVFSIAYNYAGINSDISYIGKVKKEYQVITRGSSKGDN